MFIMRLLSKKNFPNHFKLLQVLINERFNLNYVSKVPISGIIFRAIIESHSKEQIFRNRYTRTQVYFLPLIIFTSLFNLALLETGQ